MVDEEKINPLLRRQFEGRQTGVHGERRPPHFGGTLHLKAVVGVILAERLQIEFTIQKLGQFDKFHRWFLPVPIA